MGHKFYLDCEELYRYEWNWVSQLLLLKPKVFDPYREEEVDKLIGCIDARNFFEPKKLGELRNLAINKSWVNNPDLEDVFYKKDEEGRYITDQEGKRKKRSLPIAAYDRIMTSYPEEKKALRDCIDSMHTAFLDCMKCEMSRLEDLLYEVNEDIPDEYQEDEESEEAIEDLCSFVESGVIFGGEENVEDEDVDIDSVPENKGSELEFNEQNIDDLPLQRAGQNEHTTGNILDANYENPAKMGKIFVHTPVSIAKTLEVWECVASLFILANDPKAGAPSETFSRGLETRIMLDCLEKTDCKSSPENDPLRPTIFNSLNQVISKQLMRKNSWLAKNKPKMLQIFCYLEETNKSFSSNSGSFETAADIFALLKSCRHDFRQLALDIIQPNRAHRRNCEEEDTSGSLEQFLEKLSKTKSETLIKYVGLVRDVRSGDHDDIWREHHQDMADFFDKFVEKMDIKELKDRMLQDTFSDATNRLSKKTGTLSEKSLAKVANTQDLIQPFSDVNPRELFEALLSQFMEDVK